MVPQYQATMTLVVNTRDEQTTVISNDQINSAIQLVNTYAIILTNDTLLEEMIYKLGLDDRILTVSSRISASVVNQTQVMRMTMRDEEPKVAKAVLDEIMSRAPDLLITTVKAGSVEIVSPPRVNFIPVSPRPYLNTLLGAMAGIFLSMAYIFIRRYMADTFVTDGDVDKQLGLPVLGVIPSVK
jgi:capsular polysaccharide biosynthesis protein